jgi:hypothetical protein
LDLFFFLEAVYTPETYQILQSEHQFEAPFETFPYVIIDMISNLSEHPIYLMKTADDCAILVIQRLFRARAVDLVELEFTGLPEDYLRAQVQYRVNSAGAQLQAARTELSDLCAVLRTTNPAALKRFRLAQKY